MPREFSILALLLFSLSVFLFAPKTMTSRPSQTDITARARQLHFSSIVIDTHTDTTQRFIDGDFDLAPRNEKGSVDIPRMKEGGLDAVFFAVWMPSKVRGPIAVERALKQIEAVHAQVNKHSNDLVFATTADQIRAARAKKKIAVLLAVEGGHMINSDLAVLREFAGKGVRYMTLTHSGNCEWADSSTDKPIHNGLSPFGKQVIAEMNHLGMMIDVSH
ncbi:MAG TPA: membrane dipeptidase, partial [Candidatus Acidoferrum sp.]|nr:membrane dipeptidase [Candidatus Acidoferrum sp.]